MNVSLHYSKKVLFLFCLLLTVKGVFGRNSVVDNLKFSSKNNSSRGVYIADPALPVLTINVPFIDGYMSIAEAATLAGRTLSGSAGDATSVSVTLGSQQLTVQLSGGVWSATPTPIQLSLLSDGTNNIVVTATNAAGTTVLNTQAILSIQAAPTITISNFAGLNGLNYVESRTNQFVNGTSTGLQVGQIVTVRLNGVDYTTRVLSNGTWSVRIPSSALLALANTTYSLSVSAQDKAGNTTPPSSVNFNVNLSLPPTVMTINPISGDDIINAVEINGNVTISGRSIGPASAMTAVNLQVGTATYVPITDINGNWSITIPALPSFAGNGPVNVTATSVDATLTKTVTVDGLAPSLNIVTFAADNRLNATEKATAQTITGTASTEDAGQLVNLSLNGKAYFAEVLGNGSWTAIVPAADYIEMIDANYVISATLSDKGGNTITDTQSITVDTERPTVVLSSSAGNNTTASPIPFTVTFSEAVSNFTASNLTIANGTVTGGSFSGSGTTYTFTATPTAFGNVSVDIAENAARDIAGNNSKAALTITVNYQNILPVELISFKAKAEGRAVRLNWSTQSESNNQSFTLLRSDDNNNFKPITTLNGQGTKQGRTDYTFLDRSPLAGINYYQLVQTDYNGLPKAIALDVVDFKLSGKNEFVLFPNPATKEINLSFGQATSSIELIDLNGRVIEKARLAPKATSHRFQVAALPAGTYFVKLYQETGVQSLKFIKL